MNVIAVASLLLVACGSSDPSSEHLTNSPPAVRAATAAESGDVFAIGGDTAFGLAYLQRGSGDTWTRAEGVAAFDAHAKLLAHRDMVYATSSAQLFVLNGRAWNTFSLPAGATTDTEIAIDDAGRLYALELGSEGGGAVLSMLPGDNRWTEVPGTRPIGVNAASFVVDGDGRITWAVPDTGIISVVDGERRTVVDCATNDRVGGCGTTLVSFGTPDQGETFTVLACNETKRAMLRLSESAPEEDREDPVPGGASCRSFGPSKTGDPLVATFDEDGTDATLYRYRSGWNRLDADGALLWQWSAGDRAFGFSEIPIGDAPRGIEQLTF